MGEYIMTPDGGTTSEVLIYDKGNVVSVDRESLSRFFPE